MFPPQWSKGNGEDRGSSMKFGYRINFCTFSLIAKHSECIGQYTRSTIFHIRELWNMLVAFRDSLPIL